eukprot:TRINITY_DN36041_c0_g1_i1.p1 TRINITY_DN36041_c0_g1~~TRINITY_DN36041_c0_g1_i1.p1  ORF type:complete len:421 (-),score=143.56 TRINITY_DN36041_c0_g1_i1:262-1524(-)
MARTNIDAKMVRQVGAKDDSVFNAANTVELDNGCVCCNLNGELIQTISQLAEKGPFDRIVVECTGVAEPKSLVDTFTEAEETEDFAVSKVKFDNVITVVDSSAFVSTFMSKEMVEDRPDLADGEGAGEDRAVVDLLVEQVEAADVLVLNKLDQMKPAQMDRLQATVCQLNSRAKAMRSTYGQVELKELFYNAEKAAPGEGEAKAKVAGHGPPTQEADGNLGHGHGHGHAGPAEGTGHGHSHAHGHSHSNNTTAAKRFNISSFTYERRRPFKASRLSMVLQALPANVAKCVVPITKDEELQEVDQMRPMFAPVIRSKGFCWLDAMPKAALYWAQAGNFFEMQGEGAWWADAAASALPDDKAVRDKILADFKEPYGDRRQELVFIGIKMEQEQIERALDRCLLTDDEMKAYDATHGHQRPRQ